LNGKCNEYCTKQSFHFFLWPPWLMKVSYYSCTYLSWSCSSSFLPGHVYSAVAQEVTLSRLCDCSLKY
jgi:hypothetical protein